MFNIHEVDMQPEWMDWYFKEGKKGWSKSFANGGNSLFPVEGKTKVQVHYHMDSVAKKNSILIQELSLAFISSWLSLRSFHQKSTEFDKLGLQKSLWILSPSSVWLTHNVFSGQHNDLKNMTQSMTDNWEKHENVRETSTIIISWKKKKKKKK